MANLPGTVLLLGNYRPDRQESMQRFCDLLASELPQRGLSVEVIRPEPVLGRFYPGAHGLGKLLGYFDKFIAFRPRLRQRLRAFGRNDVLHICDHSNAIYTCAAAGARHLVTCHDVMAINAARGEIPQNPVRASGRLYQRSILGGLRRARRITCVSDFTRRELLRLGGIDSQRVSVSLNGLNYPYRPLPRAEALTLAKRIIGDALPANGFILHVGGNQWYKNRTALVNMYEPLAKRLANAPELWMVGQAWTVELRAHIKAANLGARVREIVDCSNEELSALYSLAELFVFPSLMEGFGWPIIEAQACGCIVATSNLPPMQEIGGEAAWSIDPNDSALAAEKLRAALMEDSAARDRRRTAGLANASQYSTARMIDRYLAEYAAIPENQ